MPLATAQNSLGDKKVVMGLQPELMDPAELLRFLKREFPDAYREVWYEAIAPNRTSGLILPGGLNGRGPVRDERHQQSDGPGDGAERGGGLPDGSGDGEPDVSP